jgi:hypothetical protein
MFLNSSNEHPYLDALGITNVIRMIPNSCQFKFGVISSNYHFIHHKGT